MGSHAPTIGLRFIPCNVRARRPSIHQISLIFQQLSRYYPPQTSVSCWILPRDPLTGQLDGQGLRSHCSRHNSRDVFGGARRRVPSYALFTCSASGKRLMKLPFRVVVPHSHCYSWRVSAPPSPFSPRRTASFLTAKSCTSLANLPSQVRTGISSSNDRGGLSSCRSRRPGFQHYLAAVALYGTVASPVHDSLSVLRRYRGTALKASGRHHLVRGPRPRKCGPWRPALGDRFKHLDDADELSLNPVFCARTELKEVTQFAVRPGHGSEWKSWSSW